MAMVTKSLTMSPIYSHKIVLIFCIYSRFHLSPFSIPCFPSEKRLFLTECCNFLFLGRKERDHLEDQGVGGKMGSEWILGRLAWGCGLDSTDSGQGPVAGCCE
jgi:hypothetical protein